ncbi:Hypothetical protein I595_3217 [Croceitalea dokdonensis DOKDO 023]|uniref:Uncharacterized protein n=1 Tax=Croceitalea dokdonensis DOKDO 023 TaxID=1300341 RepID=A0A0P7A2K5_9FLAO|nr:Hypothetical protein I595_3217 [Croceitalea dokdonensis DOKDO 023]
MLLPYGKADTHLKTQANCLSPDTSVAQNSEARTTSLKFFLIGLLHHEKVTQTI